MDTSAIQLIPIGDALPQLTADSVPIARILFDRRFAAWWSSTFQEPLPALSWTQPEGRMLRWRLLIAGKPLALLVHEDDWPVLARIARVAEASLRFSVADAVLESVAPQFALFNGGCRTTWFESARIDAPAELPTLSMARGQVYIERAGDVVVNQLLDALVRSGPVSVGGRFGGLRLPVRCLLAERRLSSEEIGALGEGDLVLLAPWSAGEPWPCRLKPGGSLNMEIDAEMMSGAPETTVRVLGNLQMTSDENASDPGVDCQSLAQLQLPVQFEIDATRLTLAELSEMGPGFVIELDTPAAQAAVRLVCQGQVVGEGQLVAIGAHLAVRIVRMGWKNEQPA